MIFDVVKLENGKLTTKREGGRYEDFFFIPDEMSRGVEVCKHFGDHDYTSGTTVEDVKRTEQPLIYDLLRAAEVFHWNMLG